MTADGILAELREIGKLAGSEGPARALVKRGAGAVVFAAAPTICEALAALRRDLAAQEARR